MSTTTTIPDAEEGGLNNNSYTNLMAVWVLNRGLEMLNTLPSDRCEELRELLGLSDEEIEHWRDISRRMRVVFHADGIISQFEGYEQLKEFDWDGYRESMATSRVSIGFWKPKAIIRSATKHRNKLTS